MQKTASGATAPILQATDWDWLNVSGRGVSVIVDTEIPLGWGFICKLPFDLIAFTRYQVFSFGTGLDSIPWTFLGWL